jgi:hypothetical protein
LIAYRSSSAEQKLQWLHAAWRLTVDFLPPRRRKRLDAMRRGAI